MSGMLPPAWGVQLTSLQSLLLNDNRLTGTLPSEWGTLGGGQLHALDFGANQLMGGFPSSWGNLSSLLQLNLGELPGPTTCPLCGGTRVVAAPLKSPLHENTRVCLPLSCLPCPQTLPFSSPPPPPRPRPLPRAEDNRFVGALPASWGGMTSLAVLSVRDMCGVCGPVPFSQGGWVGGRLGRWAG